MTAEVNWCTLGETCDSKWTTTAGGCVVQGKGINHQPSLATVCNCMNGGLCSGQLCISHFSISTHESLVP